jgi:hypothetical protein
MHTFYYAGHTRHDPGQLHQPDTPRRNIFYSEIARRGELIVEAIRQADFGPIAPPEDFGLEPIGEVHDYGLINLLQNAHRLITAEGDDAPVNANTFNANTFNVGGPSHHIPHSVWGRLGYYSFDTSSPIFEHTWDAAYWAAQTAVTAAAHVLAGKGSTAYALCRPPGHHASANLFGGFCYLNNAAIAANWMAQQGQRVAIVQVTAVIELLDSGNTIPFIARYRKEATGSLDEEQLRQIETRYPPAARPRRAARHHPRLHRRAGKADARTPRRPPGRRQPDGTGRPLPALQTEAAHPGQHRPRKGLEPLAQLILAQPRTSKAIEQPGRPLPHRRGPTIPEALAGAYDIVAEIISDTPRCASGCARKRCNTALLRSEKIANAADEKTVYHLYYDFQMRVDRLQTAPNPGHQPGRNGEGAARANGDQRDGIGCCPCAPSSGPIFARRWPNSCSWPSRRRPTAAPARPSSATCAAA